ncbi:hypothetical protein [Buttiauxella sp. S04-F03]|uniref:hypothetical protein n=1 Tax=Buttiauxella sp. S04-F03 TaxID=2904525 RepID=UPI001E530C4E|nr:hypothetical protein [Buttiauxella sp. S04-F03]MCE0811044.1 hypothetical protein [Buttiauxella sp. S04-F03]
MPLKIKNAIFYTTFFIFCCVNVFFVSSEFSGESYVIGGLFLVIITMIYIFYNAAWLKTQALYFFTSGSTSSSSLFSNILIRGAWVIFLLAVVLSNLNFIWVARVMFAGFLLIVTGYGVFKYIHLWQRDDFIGRMLRFVFYTVLPIIFIISSSYLASFFLVSAGLNIADSPLINLFLGWAFFGACVLLVIQLSLFVFYFFSITRDDVDSVLNIATTMVASMFWVIIAIGWFNNIQVYILDYATSKEWVREFNCGNLKAANYNVHYFQQDDDKYIAYFSDRGGKWGFDKVRCVIDSNGIGTITSTKLSELHKRKWFQDKG